MQISVAPLSSHPDFVAITNDPAAPLTPEEDAALFSGNWKALARLLMQCAVEARTEHQLNTPAPVPTKAG